LRDNERVYLERVSLIAERRSSDEYPFHLPAIRSLDISFTTDVTFFVGENGTGKST
jgi:predicted ATPase